MKLLSFLIHPERIIYFWGIHGHFRFLSDEQYIKQMYWTRFKTLPDLKDPKSFNEKLQWLKLYDRDPKYIQMVDKAAAKTFAAERIGEEYIIPTLGLWDSFEEIDFSALPSQFVLKCTHDSGSVIVCRDKAEFNRAAAARKLNRCLKRNYYWSGREWPYKEVRPRILAEALLDDRTGQSLKDYKVLCFGGEPRLIEYHEGRFTDHHLQTYYDTDWNILPIQNNIFFNEQLIPAPVPNNLQEMLRLSRVLAEGLCHVRVDWYSIGGRLYFGEMTLYDGSGFDPFVDPKDDLMLGSWIALPGER